jgi:uncharacterized membrane protein
VSPLVFSGIDAADGAVRVSTHDMPETYWSVSVFDADTNNFYALNDRQAKSGAADFILMPQGKSAGPASCRSSWPPLAAASYCFVRSS